MYEKYDVCTVSLVMYRVRVAADSIDDALERALVTYLIDCVPSIWEDLGASWDASRDDRLPQWDAAGLDLQARYISLHLKQFADSVVHLIEEDYTFTNCMPDATEVLS